MKIDKEEIKKAYGTAYSIQNMAAHGAEGRSTTYIGDMTKDINGHKITFRYYRDNTGAYWYKSSTDDEMDEIQRRREVAGRYQKQLFRCAGHGKII